MKKSLITQFAMMMFMAFTLSFTLASCGEEVIIAPPIEEKTVFSAGTSSFDNEEETRTFLTKDRVYLWQFADQIWVNVGGTWLKSQDSEMSPDQQSANFYFDKLLTADSYQVVYTGYGSTSATQVTIPTSFSTTTNGNYQIGQRGDCGVATATRNSDGTYSFSLLHKGAYLGIAPLKVSYLNKSYKWTKIEVADVNGKTIAGTFNFNHANGIDLNSVTSPSSKITLIAGMDAVGTNLQAYGSDINYSYTVLPPANRKLNVTYYFIDSATPTDTLSMTIQLSERDFIENNVVLFRHSITPDYYCWDAPKTKPRDGVTTNPSTVAPFTEATNVCATMPNPNELAWYVLNGDPRWDNDTLWTVDGVSYHTGGVWIKKKANIPGFSSTISPDGVDRRSTFTVTSNTTNSYLSSGKPTNAHNYFFLPALGYRAGANILELGICGFYWSSYSAPFSTATNADMAYRLGFDSNSIYVSSMRRAHAPIAGKGSDWFK